MPLFAKEKQDAPTANRAADKAALFDPERLSPPVSFFLENEEIFSDVEDAGIAHHAAGLDDVAVDHGHAARRVRGPDQGLDVEPGIGSLRQTGV